MPSRVVDEALYAAHFNLREPPFSIAPDPAFLYMSARHQEALGHLLYGAGQYGGFVQLTGEVGTGKTTIVRTLLAQKLGEVDVAMIHNPRQNELEFVQSICDELGVAYPASVASIKTLVDALNAHLLATHAAGRRTVLIIDEAQNLPVAVLEQVRLLTNLETDKDKLLRIMLIGQPELIELLARADLRQLASRITARYHLQPLTLAETTQYIIHRLQVAGGAADLFTAQAMRRVHHHSKGIPRQINILCDRALLGTYSKGYRTVTPAIVEQAATEALGIAPGPAGQVERLKKTFSSLKPKGASLRWIEGALALAALLIAGALLRETLLRPRAESPKPATAVGAAAAPSMAPTSPSKDDDANRLRAAAQPLPAVMSTLVALWKPQLKLARGENICRQLTRERLECYRTTADWNELARTDLPAILTLRPEGGEIQYALLRGIDGDSATLDAKGQPLKLTRAALEAAWRGDCLLLWARETDETSIGPQTRGAPIVWLRGRLGEAGQRPASGTASERWDNGLRDAVKTFQKAQGLDGDGVARTQTLIRLGNAGKDRGPSLKASGAAAGDAP